MVVKAGDDAMNSFSVCSVKEVIYSVEEGKTH